MAFFERYSSSWHVINSDYPMTRVKKIMYLILNGTLIFLPALKRNFVSEKFNPSSKLLEEMTRSHTAPVSPSRFLSDSFWRSLDWAEIEGDIASPIRILEVGCGSGRYGTLIGSVHPIESYCGLDLNASRDWQNIDRRNFQFFQSSFENFHEIVRDQNVIITQSALEHFDKDLLLMRQIGNYAKQREEKTYAIHLIPSSVGLFKFIFHGIRYYNLRTINKLVANSNHPSSTTVYFLGGPFSNCFHIMRITLRSLFLKKPITTIPSHEYYSGLQKAVSRDTKFGFLNSPSFYGIVMTWERESRN